MKPSQHTEQQLLYLYTAQFYIYISYTQPVSFAVATNIGQPIFFFLVYYYTSVNISNCITFLATYLSIHKINMYVYIFFCSSTFSVPSIWQCYNNNTTSLAPMSSHYVTFIFIRWIKNKWPLYNVQCVHVFTNFLSNITFSSHTEYNSEFSITQDLHSSGIIRSAVIIPYWRFGTTYRSHHHYHSRQRNTAEEQRSHLHCCKSLQSRLALLGL